MPLSYGVCRRHPLISRSGLARAKREHARSTYFTYRDCRPSGHGAGLPQARALGASSNARTQGALDARRVQSYLGHVSSRRQCNQRDAEVRDIFRLQCPS